MALRQKRSGGWRVVRSGEREAQDTAAFTLHKAHRDAPEVRVEGAAILWSWESIFQSCKHPGRLQELEGLIPALLQTWVDVEVPGDHVAEEASIPVPALVRVEVLELCDRLCTQGF